MNSSERFINIFVEADGKFKWDIADGKTILNKKAEIDGEQVTVSADFDAYNNPHVELRFKKSDEENPDNEEQAKRTTMTISSLTSFWLNGNNDGYETPLEVTAGLEVEVTSDDLGLHKYFVPDEPLGAITVSDWVSAHSESPADTEYSPGEFGEARIADLATTNLLRKIISDCLVASEQLVTETAAI